ncbi:hypothetical protein QZH45_04930 [Pseudomonas corrugata]|uniref:hypothetical protein n=1 Tax=Pseudomonas corrugata TaxID=47879 RepID=UPI0012DB183A|nr:hypothetical protein [Pseudomonas corrugata]
MRYLFESKEGEVFEFSYEQVDEGLCAGLRKMTDAETKSYLADNSAEEEAQ